METYEEQKNRYQLSGPQLGGAQGLSCPWKNFAPPGKMCWT